MCVPFSFLFSLALGNWKVDLFWLGFVQVILQSLQHRRTPNNYRFALEISCLNIDMPALLSLWDVEKVTGWDSSAAEQTYADYENSELLRVLTSPMLQSNPQKQMQKNNFKNYLAMIYIWVIAILISPLTNFKRCMYRSQKVFWQGMFNCATGSLFLIDVME